MKLAWTGEPVHHAGEFVQVDGNVALPVPVQRPHPPLWVGGNSPRAIRRAVERGDGWMPFPASPERAEVVRTRPMHNLDDLRRGLEVAHEHAVAIGRTAPLDVAFMPLGRETYSRAAEPARVVEGAADLAALGVTYLTTQLPATTRRDLRAAIERFGEEAIPAIAALTPSAAR
jgi:alkanesulfonate monooxygenase SsuD/methylene tetrahydromethanopterin reductase-like flavin-dependent oxidoreductase (luciferase family)